MDTEKRLALAFLLSMAVILVFTWQKSSELSQSDGRRAPSPTADGRQPTGNGGPEPAGTPAPPDSEERQATPEETRGEGWNWLPTALDGAEAGEVVVESGRYRVVFSKRGAVPLSWELLGYDELHADARYLRMVANRGAGPEAAIAAYELKRIEERPNGSAPVQAIDPAFEPGEAGLALRFGSSVSSRDIVYSAPRDHYRIEGQQPQEVAFSIENGGVSLTKTYIFHPDSYQVDLRVEIVNRSGAPLEFGRRDAFYDVNWLGGFGIPSLRQDAMNEAHLKLDGSAAMKLMAGLESEVRSNEAGWLPNYGDPAHLVRAETVNWVAVGQKYFLAALVPPKTGMAIQGISVSDDPDLPVRKPLAGVRMPLPRILDGATHEDLFTLYVGPKNDDEMAVTGAGLEETHQIFLRSFTAPIVHLMLRLLQGFYAIIPNYGVAIILLTLLIKILMFPLYHKQMVQMKKMQALQPHMNALKEKYKDDPQKMQKEQLELFRKHKVNPLGGCLPMLPTIPVFIALYATFGMAVELRGAPFMGWINDLSTPDQAFFIPLAGFIIPLNVLPVAYAVLMLWSMSQQKVEGPNAVMMKIFPLMFVFIFWSIASGVILYFVISIFIDVCQRMAMERISARQEAAAET